MWQYDNSVFSKLKGWEEDIVRNKGSEQTSEGNEWLTLPLCWIRLWLFSIQPQRIYAHIHGYMIICKMCIYDECHLNSSYETANAVDNLTKINT